MQKTLFAIIIALLLFGLIVLYSASSVIGQEKFGSSTRFVGHQLLYGIIPGMIALLLLRRIDYRKWRLLSMPALIGTLLLMVLVFVPTLGVSLKGATSWLNILGIVFQPSELLKLSLILYLSAWFGTSADRVKNWKFGIIPFVLIVGFSSILLLKQPDIGTLGIVLIISIGMYFVAGLGFKQTIIILLLGLVVMGGFVVTNPEKLERVRVLVQPDYNPRGASWQLNQALIAIGSGGLWGVGYGQSTQKFGFLPETIADSIYAIIVEELGFIGGAFTILLFASLATMLIFVSIRAPDAFGQLFAAGMAIWIMTQAVMNMAAITGLIPLTGIPLPFISFGGTSMLSLLAGLGVALNIAKRADSRRSKESYDSVTTKYRSSRTIRSRY